MNPAHFHLIASHVPVMGMSFGLCLFLFALLRKNEELRRVALLVFALAAFLTLPTYLSGPAAADLLGRLLPGVTTDARDQHAEVAVLALAGVLTLGVTCLTGLTLFRQGRRLPAGFLVLVLLLAVLACALLGWTAHLGGRIRHLEIRPQTSTTPISGLAEASLEFGHSGHEFALFAMLPGSGAESRPPIQLFK